MTSCSANASRWKDAQARDGSAPCVFFFFQAEDGIRDWSVTGVQTCAFPISYAVFCLKIEHHTSEVFSLTNLVNRNMIDKKQLSAYHQEHEPVQRPFGRARLVHMLVLCSDE